jgi:hypothetical protein
MDADVGVNAIVCVVRSTAQNRPHRIEVLRLDASQSIRFVSGFYPASTHAGTPNMHADLIFLRPSAAEKL